MNKILFYTLLIISILVFSSHTYAQPNLKSGSLQIIVSNSGSVITEITGPLSFKETISENLILSNLMPGEYMVRVYSSQMTRRGMPNQANIASRMIIVSTEQRTIINISRDYQISIRSVFDENSQYIHASINPNVRQGPGNQNYFPGVQPMNESEFNQFYNAVRRESFDSGKFKIISSVADYTLFNTEQIGQVMKLFSSDKDKLECAKTMSTKVYDKQNLYLLADQFSFSSTKNEFFDFINKK